MMGTNSTGCTEWERDFDPVTEQPIEPCPYCGGDETRCDFNFETERCSQMAKTQASKPMQSAKAKTQA